MLNKQSLFEPLTRWFFCSLTYDLCKGFSLKPESDMDTIVNHQLFHAPTSALYLIMSAKDR